MVRDDEIERLVKYAESMNVHVVFSDKKDPDCTAEMLLDGSQIIIYNKKNTTKIGTVLSLIHEIAHILDFIHGSDRKIDTKFADALPEPDEEEISKGRRKIILDGEIEGSRYWETIYKEMNLSFPIWKLHAQMEYDLAQYEIYYLTGSYPSQKEKHAMRKLINARHRKIKYG